MERRKSIFDDKIELFAASGPRQRLLSASSSPKTPPKLTHQANLVSDKSILSAWTLTIGLFSTMERLGKEFVFLGKQSSHGWKWSEREAASAKLVTRLRALAMIAKSLYSFWVCSLGHNELP